MKVEFVRELPRSGTGASPCLVKKGEEFFVVRDEIGDQLLKLVDKNVKATGVINVGTDGKKNMKINCLCLKKFSAASAFFMALGYISMEKKNIMKMKIKKPCQY